MCYRVDSKGEPLKARTPSSRCSMPPYSANQRQRCGIQPRSILDYGTNGLRLVELRGARAHEGHRRKSRACELCAGIQDKAEDAASIEKVRYSNSCCNSRVQSGTRD